MSWGRNYEILEFFDGFNRIVRISNGKFTKSMQYFYTERELLKSENQITRVRRIKDSKIFEINTPFHEDLIIKEFKIINDKLNIILQ